MRRIIQPCGLHCIKVNHLGVAIGSQEILTDINLHIHCGTLNAVIGKNGAGKSTLVKTMLGELPHTGSIEFKDREDGPVRKMKIGYVPQAIHIEKHTPVSVYDLIASFQSRFPVFLHKRKRLYDKIRESLGSRIAHRQAGMQFIRRGAAARAVSYGSDGRAGPAAFG